MANAYKGLTINFGGDTTKLQKALRLANNAAAETGSELRKLNKALTLDPSNVEAYNLQVGYMAQQAQNAAVKLATLKRAHEEVSEQMLRLTDAPLKEVADATENAGLKAAEAKSRYNELRDSLSKVYTELSDKSRDVGLDVTSQAFAGFGIKDGDFDLKGIADARKAVEEFDATLDRMPDAFSKAKEGAKDFATTVSGLIDAIESAEPDKAEEAIKNYVDTVTAAKDEFEKAVTSFKGYRFDENNVDMENLAKAIDSLAPSINMSKKQVDEWKAEIELLKNSFIAAKDELMDANLIARFKDLEAEIELAAATMESLRSVMSKIEGPSQAARVVTLLSEETKLLEQEWTKFRAAVNGLDNTLKFDPSNTNAITLAMKTLSDETLNVQERIDKIQSQIDGFDAHAIAEATDPLKSAQQQVDDAAEALSAAEAWHDSIIGKLKAEEDEYSNLEASVKAVVAAMNQPDRPSDETGLIPDEDDVKHANELWKSIKSLRERAEEAAAPLKQLRQNLEMAKERQELEDLNVKLEETRSGFGLIDERVRQFAQSLADSVRNNAVKEAFGQGFERSLSQLDAAFDSAKQRAEVFGNAIKFDPANITLVESRMDALKDAEEASAQKAIELRTAIDSVASGGIDASTVQRLEDAYGSVDLAVKATSDEVERLVAAMHNASGDDVAKLAQELNKARAAAAEAAATQRWQQLQAELAKVNANAAEIGREFAKMTADSAVNTEFGEAIEQMARYDAAIERATSKAKALSEALKEDPDNKALNDEKANAFAAALQLIEDRAQLVSETFANIDTAGIERIKEEFSGSISLAVSELSSKLASLMTEYDQLRDKLIEVASAGGHDQEWVDAVIRGEVAADGAGTEVTELVEQIHNLNEESGRIDADLRLAAIGQAAEDASNRGRAQMNALGDASKKSANDSDAAFQQAFSTLINYAERAGKAAVEAANTIDSAFRDMKKTVNGTEQDFVAIREEAVKFSQTHAVSADTILEMESLGGQLGVTVDKLREFGEVTSNLDIATDIPAEEIALQLGQITNIMSDLDFDTFEQFADALVRLGNNTATTESAIMNVAQRMSAVANVTSMTTPQLLGWSAAIASTGQRAESAATAVNNSITGIGKAVAAGGNTLEQFAKIAGMSADEFKSKWQNSSSEALEAFVKGLNGLTDSSTDAIAALESVGIKSVRQTTALLALSQTIENLDSAITMSGDAFNGVSDQWGAAGDAAREAQNKSEGFSGSLKILQNNAANLAAVVGDSMTPFLQAAAAALKTLTDALSILPDWLVMTVAGFTGFIAVSGTAYELITKVAKGFKSLATAKTAEEMTSLGSAVSGLATKLSGLGGAFVTASGGASMLATTISTGLVMGGIMLAVTAVAALVSAIGEWVAKEDEARKAVDDLHESSKSLGTTIDELTGNVADMRSGLEDNGLDTYKRTAEDTNNALRELTESQNRLKESLESKEFELKVKYDSIEEAKAVIDEYADSTSTLTYEQQADLISAVEQLNDVMGTEYEVIDAANGIIKEHGEASATTKEEVLALADAWVQAAQQEAMVEASKEIYTEIVRQKAALEEKRKALEEAQKATAGYKDALAETASANAAFRDGNAQVQSQMISTGKAMLESTETEKNLTREIQEGEKALASITSQYESVNGQLRETKVKELEAADAARKAMESFLKSKEAFSSVFSDTQDMSELAAMLIHLGVTTEDLASLTDAQLTEMARSYDGNINTIIALLSKLGVSLDDTKAKTGDTAEAIQKASDDEIAAQKEAFDREYEDRKRHLEDVYNQQKDAYDREEEELKRSLDAEYDALKNGLDREYDLVKHQKDQEYEAVKNALDKEYEEHKKALDAIYDETKRQFDREYTEYKRQYDQLYDERKRALDKEYNLAKSEYDRQYDQLKKQLDRESTEYKRQLDDRYEQRKRALDREYKLAQQQSKAYLSDYKKALDAEADAFKDATDARVAEMKREYEQRKRYLDLEEKRITKQIDDRIQALKDETEMQDRLTEAKERSLKTEELQKKVDAAKSRRLKAEAQRELDSYKEETAAKNAKYARDDEIKRLEQEKKDVKDQYDEKRYNLKEQYDLELEEYKASRAALLEALKEHNAALYEEQQNAETLRLDDVKLRHQDELAEIKLKNDDALAAFKDGQAATLEEQKLAYDERLAELKLEHEGELAELKFQQEDELAEIKAGYDLRLQALKDEHAAELEEHKLSNSQYLEEYKFQQQLELDDLKLHNEAILNEKKLANEDAVNAMKDGHEAAMAELKREHEDELNELKNNQSNIVSAMQEGDSQIKTEAASTAGEVKNSTLEAAREIKDNTDQATNHVNEKTGGTAKFVRDKFGEIKGIVKDDTKQAADDADKNFDDISNKAEKHTGGAERIVRDKLGQIKGVVRDDTKQAADDADRQIGRIPTETEKHFKDFERGATESGKAVTRNVNEELDPLPEDAGRKADETNKSFGSALSATMEITDAVRAIADTVADGIDLSDESETWGHDLITNLANGFYLGDVVLGNALQWVADQISAVLGHSVPKEGPLREGGKGEAVWGRHLVENLAEGILDNAYVAVRAATSMAGSMSDETTDVLEYMQGIASDAGRQLSKSFADSIDPNDARDAMLSTYEAMHGVLLSMQDMARKSGRDFGLGFVEGMESTIPKIGGMSKEMASMVAMYLHHSTPDKGPLAGDDEWGAEFGYLLADGMKQSMRMIEDRAMEMAATISSAFDFTHALDSALDAMDRLERAQKKALDQQMAAMHDMQSTALDRAFGGMSGGISVTINMANVSLGSQQDVEALANELAGRIARSTRRSQAATLGR